MSTLMIDSSDVQAVGARFQGNILQMNLNDGREILIDMKAHTWLEWLHKATPEERADWSIEPGGYAIYWDRLDDGIEVKHMLEIAQSNGKLD